MPRLITRITQDGPSQRLLYTREEVERLLEKGAQPDVLDTKTHLLRDVASDRAMDLAAIWLRRFDVDPGTIGYLPEVQALWTYHVKGDTREPWKKAVQAYDLAGVDEQGPLYAEPGAREIDPLPLLQCLAELLSEGVSVERIQQALAAAGYEG